MDTFKQIPRLKNTNYTTNEINYTPTAKEVKARYRFDLFYEYVICEPQNEALEAFNKGADPKDRQEYYYGVEKHHKEWILALVTGKSSPQLNLIAGDNTNILAPRGSSKSTLMGAFIAWAIGHNPAIRIMLVSYNASTAESKSRNIMNIIGSERFKRVFPYIEINPNRKAVTNWEIDKYKAGVEASGLLSDYTLYATGITGGIASRRADLIVGDDIINGDDIDSDRYRERVYDNWYQLILPCLTPNGRIIDIGTVYHAMDCHTTIFNEKKGWKVLRQSAIVADPISGEEKSYWETYFPLKLLQKKREEDPVGFSFQYQNIVVRVSETSIDPSWIHKRYPLDISRYDSLAIGIDLSASLKETADYTVFTLCGRYDTWNEEEQKYDTRIDVIDYRRGRWAGNQDKLDVLLDLLLEWDIVTIGEVLDINNNWTEVYQPTDNFVTIVCEEVAYQMSMESDFKRYFYDTLQLYNIAYKGIKTKGKDKLVRLRGVSGLFQNSIVGFNILRDTGIIVEELINFGATQHDDTVDSLVYVLQHLSKRSKIDAL